MKVRPGNAQHQGARESQQDSFGFSDLDDRAFVAHAGFLAVVADGMGGLSHGGAAGAAAVHALLQAYAAKSPDESIPAALVRSLRQANQAVVDLAQAAGEAGQVGTTAAVAVVHDASLHWIAAGDSRVYVWRAGRLTQVTADHIYAAELDAKVAAGQVSEEDARADPDREALTSHLGRTPLRRMDRSVRPFPLFEGDRVLVCSDGVYRALTPAELETALAGNPQRACEALVARALAKQLPRQDNMTALVIGLDADGVTTDTTMTVTDLAEQMQQAPRDGANVPDAERVPARARLGRWAGDREASASARGITARSWRAWALGAAAALMVALVTIAIVFYVTCCPPPPTPASPEKPASPPSSTPVPPPPAGGAEQPR